MLSLTIIRVSCFHGSRIMGRSLAIVRTNGIITITNQKDIIELKLRVLGYRKKLETLERQIHHV